MDLSAIEFTTAASVPAILLLLLGFVGGCLLSAMCLRQAIKWLHFDELSYWESFRVAVLVKSIFFIFSILIGLNYGFVNGLMSAEGFGRFRDWVQFAFPPIFYVYYLALTLVVSAAILRQFVTQKNEDSDEKIQFIDGVAVTSVHLGLSTAVALLLLLMVGGGISLILWVAG